MTECPSCALEVTGNPDTCPYCGYEFPSQSKGIKLVAYLFVIIMLWPLYELVMYLVNR